jgi:hypothetical protein
MAKPEPLVAGEGARLLDRRSFGKTRSWLATILVFGGLVLMGLFARSVHLQMNTIERLVPIGWDGAGARSTGSRIHFDTVSHVPPRARVFATALLVVPPSAYALAVLGGLAIRRLRRWRWRRADLRMARPSADAPLGEARDGQRVCVRGTVLPAPGFTSATGARGAIVASYLGSVGSVREAVHGARSCWELQAVDFSLGLDGGGEVAVRVAGGTLLGRPAAAPAGLGRARPLSARSLAGGAVAAVYREQVIAPGDVVEVSGVLSSEIDAAADAADAGARGARLRRRVASDPRSPLVIHFVRGRPDGCRF